MADNVLAEAEKSLARIQNFDADALPRLDALGSEMNFLDAVPGAERIISLFRQIPLNVLPEFPDDRLETIKSRANSTFSLFEQILKFDPKANTYAERTNLIDSLNSHYQPLFDALSPIISYASSRLQDFASLEREARAAVQSAKDRADEATKALEKQQEEASRILDEVRKVAAEQGVSQQATYFKIESEEHETSASTWQKYTLGVAGILVLYALISATAHKWTWLSPSGPYEAIQLALSKVLIFGVIAYLLALAAKSFLAHRHNAVVNRHRYNALLTFTALAEAANSSENRDVVLNHAASCIFAPQDTGYTKGGQQPDTVANIIQSLPRAISSQPPGSQ